MRALVWILILILSTPALSQGAPKTLRVPTQYATIQLAIKAASNGDSILVENGVYKGPVDFMGREITVRSARGPAATIIDGQNRDHAVVFGRGEGQKAIIEGFTIRNATHGIACVGGSWPIIRNNIIKDNRSGIYCDQSSAFITLNEIKNNVNGIEATPYGLSAVQNMIVSNRDHGILYGVITGSGGARIDNNVIAHNGKDGIHSVDGCDEIRDNLIHRNGGDGIFLLSVSDYSGGVIENNTILNNTGDGIDFDSVSNTMTFRNNIIAFNDSGIRTRPGEFNESDLEVFHNTIVSNVKYGLRVERHESSTKHVKVTNSILYWNGVQEISIISSQLKNPLTVTCSDIRGIQPGNGNFDADPRFVESARGDFHLCHDSPCRDMGTTAGVAVDVEGDPRTRGGKPDIGADEFHPHHYTLGMPTPGKRVEIRIIGEPGTDVYWGASTRLQQKPAVIPNLGTLYLGQPLHVLGLGKMTGAGYVSFAIEIPVSTPIPSVVFLQALAGDLLTNLDGVVIL